MEIIVCDKYRLGRSDGGFNKEFKKLIRKGAKITRDYYEQINANTQDSGLMYVIDEQATEQYYKDAGQQYEARKQRERFQNEAALNLVNAVQGMAKHTAAVESKPEPKPQPKEEPKEEENKPVELPTGEPNENWEHEQLVKYCEDNGLEFKKTFGAKRLFNEVIKPHLEDASESNNNENG